MPNGDTKSEKSPVRQNEAPEPELSPKDEYRQAVMRQWNGNWERR